jgi:hypothetical protein
VAAAAFWRGRFDPRHPKFLQTRPDNGGYNPSTRRRGLRPGTKLRVLMQHLQTLLPVKGWPNDPRYWDSSYARWHNEPEPEPDIYLLQTSQTASNFLIR